jgi:hypothetical protein
MDFVPKRSLGTFLVVLLAVSAGCQSLGGETSTSTSTDEESEIPFLETHESTIRDAGNVTINRSTTIQRTGESSYTDDTITVTDNQSTFAQIDFESDQLLVEQESLIGSDSTVVYRNETGATFERLDGGDTYLIHPTGNELTVDIDTMVELFATETTNVERRGQGSVDGVSGTVYMVSSPDELSFGTVDADNITSFRVTYVVGDDGYATYQRVNYTAERENLTVEYTETTRITAVGSTDVEPPSWLDEARENGTVFE